MFGWPEFIGAVVAVIVTGLASMWSVRWNYQGWHRFRKHTLYARRASVPMGGLDGVLTKCSCGKTWAT